MKISGDRKLLIWVTLSLLFVFMLGTKSLAATEFKLLASDGAAGDEFGQSVSISGNVALVGAPGSDDKGTDSGKAYVFRWNGSNWVEEQKLLAPGGATIDHFGTSVSIDGDVALVGADEDEDDDGKEGGPGSAYVFRWNGSSWVEEQKLLASDGASGEMFGTSVSISGNVALVGAVNEGSNTQEGKAYVFRWNGSSWVEEQKLLASDGAAGAVFGVSVSISGNVALVGATEEEKFPLGSGKAYVFRWNGSNWVQEQRLLSSDGASGDEFGGSVSIDGDVALVGADSDDDEKGSAYVFRWNGSNWVEEQKLLASDGATEDEFGSSVSISGNVALVGAIEEEKTVHSSGKAYVFRWNGSSWVEEQKLLASDGAAGAVFGVSVSISGNVALVGATEEEKIVPGPGKAYIYALDEIVDVLAYTPVTPCRIVDTRKSGGAISAGGTRSYNVRGNVASQGGNPAGCPSLKGEPRSVHINVTSVPLSNGWITAYPYGSTAPTASLVNYRSNAQNVANSGTIKTCFNCAKDISIKSGGGTTHVIIDVLGYYYRKP